MDRPTSPKASALGLAARASGWSSAAFAVRPWFDAAREFDGFRAEPSMIKVAA